RRSRWPGWGSPCRAGWPSATTCPSRSWSLASTPCEVDDLPPYGLGRYRQALRSLGGLARGTPGDAAGGVRDRLAPAGVGRRQDQPPEHAEVLEELDLLVLAGLLVVLAPERVTDVRRRHQRTGERKRGQP